MIFYGLTDECGVAIFNTYSQQCGKYLLIGKNDVTVPNIAIKTKIRKLTLARHCRNNVNLLS